MRRLAASLVVLSGLLAACSAFEAATDAGDDGPGDDAGASADARGGSDDGGTPPPTPFDASGADAVSDATVPVDAAPPPDPPLALPGTVFVCAASDVLCAPFEGAPDRLDWYLPFGPPQETNGSRAYLSAVARDGGALGSVVRAEAGSKAQLESRSLGSDLRTTMTFWLFLRTLEGSAQPLTVVDHRIEAARTIDLEVRLTGRRLSLLVDGTAASPGSVDVELASWTPLALRQRTTFPGDGTALTTFTLLAPGGQTSVTHVARGVGDGAQRAQRLALGLARATAGTFAEVSLDDVRVTIP